MLRKINRAAAWGLAAFPLGVSLLGLYLSGFSASGLEWWASHAYVSFRASGILILMLAAFALSFSCVLLKERKPDIGFACFIGGIAAFAVIFIGGAVWSSVRNSNADNIGLASLERVKVIQARMGEVFEASPSSALVPLNIELMKQARSARHDQINQAHGQVIHGAFQERYQRLFNCLSIMGWSNTPLAHRMARQGWATPGDLLEVRSYARSQAEDQKISLRWTPLQQRAFLVLSGETPLDEALSLSEKSEDGK